MSFAPTLEAYRKALDCTNRDISKRSGLPASTISRYLNGERVPTVGSENIRKLAEGLVAISLDQDTRNPYEADNVLAALEAAITGTRMVGMDFHMRLDALMHLAGLSNAAVAEVVGVDPSYISRIRHGQRMPANVPRFATLCAHLAAIACIETDKLADLGELVGMPDITSGDPEWDPYDESNTAEVVEVWLKGSQIVQSDIAKFEELLTWIDETDLSEWLSMSEADDVAIEIDQPSPLARFYYGLGGMRTAELDFLTMAANTHSRNLFLSSDMPLMRIPPDSRFIRQYGKAMTNVMKTGCRVNVFYNIERPLEETIRSLRIWMPLYISGQVTPYYLKGLSNRLFYHMNYSCDTCALSAEAVVGHIEDGRYYFTTRPEDVSYYQRKMQCILEKASSLLEIYRDCDPGQQEAFEKAEAERQAKNPGRRICEGRFHKLQVQSYPGDCTVLMLPCGPTVVRFVIRHPKINYIVAHMK